MGNRRKGRECALQILYQMEILANSQYPKGCSASEQLSALRPGIINQATEDFFINFEAPKEVFEQASSLVRGTIANILKIDHAIGKKSQSWRLDRMTKVDRNILRIATYELFFSLDLSRAIIIDEAIEIARRFGSEQSATFVNGLLDAISVDAREQASRKKNAKALPRNH